MEVVDVPSLETFKFKVQLKVSQLIAMGWQVTFFGPYVSVVCYKQKFVTWKISQVQKHQMLSICTCFKRQGTLGEWWPLFRFHSLTIKNKCCSNSRSLNSDSISSSLISLKYVDFNVYYKLLVLSLKNRSIFSNLRTFWQE